MTRPGNLLSRLLLIGGTIGLLLLTLVALSSAQPIESAETEKLRIVRVPFANQAQLYQLISEYDVWEVDGKLQTVLLVADPLTLVSLKENGFYATYEPRLTQFHLRQHDARSIETFFGGYKNNDELIAELEALNAEYPNLTEP